MAFWLLAIVIAVLSVAVLFLAVIRPRKRVSDAARTDMAFYRQQLEEIERDIARGVLSSKEGETVRVEVARRLLDADKRKDETAALAPKANRVWAAAVALFVFAGSLVTYLQMGAPAYPDLPIEKRLAEADEFRANRARQAEVEARITIPPAAGLDASAEYLELVDKLREAVKGRADDLQGQMLLAQHEARLGNYSAAHQALRRIIEIRGDDATADDWSNYADMLVIAAGGYVSPEAEQALSRAMSLDPRNGTARYYVGLMFAQTGRPDRAFEFWRPLLEDSAPQDPWVEPIRAQIADVAADAGISYTVPDAAPLRGPTADDVAAAQDMSEQDRMAMIEGMVANLSERLATEGGTAEEWARLIRSLGVIGRTRDARDIAAEASGVFAGNADAIRLIEEAAASLDGGDR